MRGLSSAQASAFTLPRWACRGYPHTRAPLIAPSSFNPKRYQEPGWDHKEYAMPRKSHFLFWLNDCLIYLELSKISNPIPSLTSGTLGQFLEAVLRALAHHGTRREWHWYVTLKSTEEATWHLGPLRPCQATQEQQRSISQHIHNPLLQDTHQETHSKDYYSMTKQLPNQIPHRGQQADNYQWEK